MSKAHLGSKLIPLGRVQSSGPDTLMLCHFDVTENDVLQGTAPVSKTVTLRQDGKFGGCVAIEEATTNKVTNGDFSVSQTVSYGWNNSLNGTLAPDSWSTYNGGVPSANVGYHAHLNVSRFNFPVIEFIDKNSPFGSGLKHRWLGISQSLGSNASLLGFGDGSKVSVSFDLMVDHIDKKMEYGIYHRNSGNTVNTFADAYTGVFLDKPFEWQRVESTFTLSGSNWDFSQFASLYLYGHMARNDYEGTAWVKNVQIEMKPFATSFTSSSRSSGVLKYSKSVLYPDEGTISFWLYAKTVPATPNPVFSSGVDSASGAFDLLIGSTDYLRVFGESANAQLNPVIPKGRWCHIAVTWKKSQFLRIYVDGLLDKESIGTTDWSTAFSKNASGFYLGSGIRNNPNVLIDEFRVDRVARTQEDILSWVMSGSPFSPQGIYRITY